MGTLDWELLPCKPSVVVLSAPVVFYFFHGKGVEELGRDGFFMLEQVLGIVIPHVGVLPAALDALVGGDHFALAVLDGLPAQLVVAVRQVLERLLHGVVPKGHILNVPVQVGCTEVRVVVAAHLQVEGNVWI